MNEEQINRYSSSLYRQIFLLKMIDAEHNYFAKFKAPSGIKNELNRLKTVYAKGVDNLAAQMPKMGGEFRSHIAHSEERISACLNILEKLAVIPEEKVFELEDIFSNLIKIDYKNEKENNV
jgi:hypothetical protein